MASRTVREGQQKQGIEEAIAYEVDCANWCASSPQNVQVKAYSLIEGIYADVTATVMPSGTATVEGSKIKLPILRSLTEGVVHRIEVKFDCLGNTLEFSFSVKAER